MSIHYSSRKILMGVAAVALPLTFITVESGVASAATVTPTGTVSCTQPKIKIAFNPFLMVSTGGKTDTVTGKLKNCTATPAQGITKLQGSISATISGPNTGIDGLATGSYTVDKFTIIWKGKVNGAKATFANSVDTVQGNNAAVCPGSTAGFKIPNPGPPNKGSVVTGSFAGSSMTISTVCSATTQSQILAKAEAHGFKSLKLTSGTIHIG